MTRVNICNARAFTVDKIYLLHVNLTEHIIYYAIDNNNIM